MTTQTVEIPSDNAREVSQDNITIEMQSLSDTNSIPIVYKQESMVKKALNEDIYHLVAVIYNKNKRLPLTLCVMAVVVFLVQCLALAGMVWGYELENNYSEVLMNGVQYLSISNQTTAAHTGGTSSDFIWLKQIGEIPGLGDDFNPFDYQQMADAVTHLSKAKNFMGFMSIFVLLLYLMQSLASYTFLWYIPDYIDKYKNIKYTVKFISFVNILMAYVAWMIGVWTLFNVGGLLDIIDMITTPLGIVFVLEVDDWLVKVYMLLEFDDDDGDDDDDYDGGEELWVVKTNKQHVTYFKWTFLVIVLCFVTPPCAYRAIQDILNINGMNDDAKYCCGNHPISDNNMISGGLAWVTYTIVAGIIIIAISIRLLVKYCSKKNQ